MGVRGSGGVGVEIAKSSERNCPGDLQVEYFSERIKEQGLKSYFSNEMMWKFKGEEKAVNKDLENKTMSSPRMVFRRIPEGGIAGFGIGVGSCAIGARVEAVAWNGSGKAVVHSLSG